MNLFWFAVLLPLIEAGPDRIQLGSIIRHQSLDCDCVFRPVSWFVYKSVAATSKEPVYGNEITLEVNPTKNRVTTLTQPGATPVNTSEGCIEVIFVKQNDIKVVKTKLKDVRDNMLLIFLKPNMLSLNDDDLIKNLSGKKVSLGFFHDDVLTNELRDKFLSNGLSFFENLQRPQNYTELLADDRVYYGFKFVFSPMGIETSLPESLNAIEPTRKINLADLVVYDSKLETITNRCSRKSYLLFSQKWGPAQNIPVYEGVLRPELTEDQKRLVWSDHFGTHIDAPPHFDPNSPVHLENLPATLDHPICQRVSVPFQERPDFPVGRADLTSWESENNKLIAENSFVLIDTGYAMAKWAAPDKYVLNYPGISMEAAKFLVEERHIAAVGIDSLAMDDYSLTSLEKFPVHAYLASKGIPVVLNLGGDLNKFVGQDGICVMSYLRFENGTGSQVALFGLLPELPQTPSKPSNGASVPLATAIYFTFLLVIYQIK